MATTFDPRAIANGSITGSKIAAGTITATNLASNAVTGAAIRLGNDQYLRARNAADDDDVQIVKVNNANRITFASIPQFSGTPSAPNDVVNVSYLDARLEGLKPKESVRLATTAADGNLDLSTGGLLTIDGLPTVAGDRILVKNQTAAAQNGIYIADTNAWVRAADANTATELEGAYTIVREGSENGLKGWVQTAIIGTLGTSPVTFVQFSATTAMIGGDMITVSGATISVDLASDSGLESTNPGNDAGQLRIKLEGTNPTLHIQSNALGVKLDAARALTVTSTGIGVNLESTQPSLQITSNELGIKFDAVGGLSKGAAGTKVNTDGSTTKINGSNQVEGLKTIEETFVVTGAMISNGYVDLSHMAYGTDGTNSISLCLAGFPIQQKGIDYGVDIDGGTTVTRINFTGYSLDGFLIDTPVADKIIVTYSYL